MPFTADELERLASVDRIALVNPADPSDSYLVTVKDLRAAVKVGAIKYNRPGDVMPGQDPLTAAASQASNAVIDGDAFEQLRPKAVMRTAKRRQDDGEVKSVREEDPPAPSPEDWALDSTLVVE